jgi:hypothetical protein
MRQQAVGPLLAQNAATPPERRTHCIQNHCFFHISPLLQSIHASRHNAGQDRNNSRAIQDRNNFRTIQDRDNSRAMMLR